MGAVLEPPLQRAVGCDRDRADLPLVDLGDEAGVVIDDLRPVRHPRPQQQQHAQHQACGQQPRPPLRRGRRRRRRRPPWGRPGIGRARRVLRGAIGILGHRRSPRGDAHSGLGPVRAPSRPSAGPVPAGSGSRVTGQGLGHHRGQPLILARRWCGNARTGWMGIAARPCARGLCVSAPCPVPTPSSGPADTASPRREPRVWLGTTAAVLVAAAWALPRRPDVRPQFGARASIWSVWRWWASSSAR